MGVDMSAGPPPASQPPPSSTPSYNPPPPKQEEAKKELSDAEKLKEDGNKAFRAKQYEEARQCYEKALELEPQEILYINNKAAVYFAQKNYEKSIELCDEAVSKGREVFADYSKIARAFSRKAMVLGWGSMVKEFRLNAEKSLTKRAKTSVSVEQP